MKISTFVLGLITITSAVGNAQELVFSDIRLWGQGEGVRCKLNPDDPSTPNNVQVITYGNQISFLFTDFGITLEPRTKGEPKPEHVAICNIAGKILIPQGHYIDEVNQTLQGGILKDKGTRAQVVAWGALHRKSFKVNRIEKNFGRESEITADSARSYISEYKQSNFNKMDFNIRKIQCHLTKNGPAQVDFAFHLHVGAFREGKQKSIRVNIDSSDISGNVQPMYTLDERVKRCQ